MLLVGQVAPALFSADATGAGFAAGSALLVRADNSRTETNLARYDSASGKFVALPIDVGGANDQVYLILYGTGIKNRSGLANVKIKIGGVDVAADYAGAQGFFVGLDQINVKVPRSLLGRGDVDVSLTVDGKVANTIKVNVK